MFCPNCGNKMDSDAKFCSNCGWSKNSGTNKFSQKFKKLENFDLIKIIFVVVLILILALFAKFVVPHVMSMFETAKIVMDDDGREYYVDKDGNRLFNTWIVFKGNDYHLDDMGFIDKSKWVDVLLF